MSSKETPRKTDNSRRNFLKTSAVVGGAAATSFTAANAVHAQGSDILKGGLIGCGGRGPGAAAHRRRGAARRDRAAEPRHALGPLAAHRDTPASAKPTVAIQSYAY